MNQEIKKDDEKTIMVTHGSHCAGTCMLKVHVKNGVITRIGTDDGEEPQYRACAKGRAYRQRIYAPDRLSHPLKRTGARGEGKFSQVSWDEALDTIARELTRIKDTYGPESILLKWSGGDQGVLHGSNAHRRLFFMNGGCSEVWGTHSFEGATFAQIATFGTVATSNTRDSLLSSRLIIMWGWNPADTQQHTNTIWYLVQAKEGGSEIVSVDPKYTNTAAVCSNQWIPIIPGTDTAMLMAMAYTIIEDNLQDQKFLDTYTVGYDRFRDYVLGKEDGIPKTPQWAELITGVSATVIQNLARRYATIKPAALMSGIGCGRTAYGEQFHRTTATLAAMTGNIGIHGGDAGVSAFTGIRAQPFLKLGPGLPVPVNPVNAITPPRKNALPDYGNITSSREGYINQSKVADAILKGRSGGYPTDYKLLYVVNNNFPNQYTNINKCVQALKSLDFIVVLEQFMTPGAKFADIILPVNTCLERNDIITGSGVGLYGFMGKAIESIGESKSHLEICTALASKLGIPDYSNKTEEEWLKQIVQGMDGVEDYESFKKAGGYKMRRQEPHIAFRPQIEDPAENPFPTPSGKIEIYCQRIADMNDPLLPSIPKYMETWEGRNDPLTEKYPLQLVTSHQLVRAHSQYHNIPWLREVQPQRILVNSIDAEDRGIKNGDIVSVFNDRGVTTLPAEVTERIMQGVVDIPQGAWYDPDENGVDRGGCANVLTRDEHSPGGAYVTNTCLVQVEKP